MTRVTMVSYDDEPPLGGQGIVLRGLRTALSARGHIVDTVAGRGDHALRYPRVSGRAPLDFSLQLNRHPELIRRLCGDVVHASGGPGGVLLLRECGAPLVYTAHHTYRQAHGAGSLRRLLSPVEARSYRRASMVLAVSPSTAQAVHLLGVPRSRVEVLAPGVDGPLLAPPPRDPARLLFAGRWETEKGVLDAVTVMRAVLTGRSQASAAIAGSGRLESEVRRAVAGSPIEILGRVEETRLREEYARAALVLMPSLYEGLGLVALEAQASGALVVGYDVDGLRDAVPQTGLLVAPGDLAAAVAVCEALIDDPRRREELGTQAESRVRAQHSWAAVAVRLEQVYSAVVGG